MVKVKVQWGKEKYDNVELDETQDLANFRAVLFSLTNVPGPKQKILYKGSVLKDETSLSSLNIPENATLMLMGSAEERKIQEPSKKTVFIEDLTPEERSKILKEKTGEALPVGLVNMGNTCYMNASLQCLRRINEFKEGVMKYKGGAMGDPFTAAFQRLVSRLETKGDSFMPYEFFNGLVNMFPQFGEMAGKGLYKQQDADECFQSMLDVVYPHLSYENEEGDKYDLIDYLFRIELEATLRCAENPDEEPQVKTESLRKLPCIIDNQNNPINNLSEGIKIALEENIEKTSPSLGRMAEYHKISRIKKLPPYLIVQKIRFMWKKAAESAGTKATKAKILRNVAFPKVLDTYDFCTPELQKALDTGRVYEKKKAEEKSQSAHDKFEAYKKKLEAEGKMIDEGNKQLFNKWKEEQKEEDIKEHDETLYRKIGTGLETGNYELIAVLTHQGRTSDSGHYVAWVHKKGEDWYKYDDDKVSEVKLEEILNLRGGGDWHMAYYCIYRKIEIV